MEHKPDHHGIYVSESRFRKRFLIIIWVSTCLLSAPAFAQLPEVRIGRSRVRVVVIVETPRIPVWRPIQRLGNIAPQLNETIIEPTIGQVVGIGKTAYRFVNDVYRESKRGASNVVSEINRAGDNLIDVGRAIERYCEIQYRNIKDMASDNLERFKEGKVIDALFHLALDPYRTTEKAAFAATQESSVVNIVGGVAAGAYFGPYGSAAYASWQAYRASGGDAELAMKAGVIAGLTSKALGIIGESANNGATDIAKKAVLSGTVCGIAVAASGGSEGDITEAAARAAVMVVIQDNYKKTTGHELDGKGADQEAYCASKGNPTCQELADAYKDGKYKTGKLDTRRVHTGVQATVDQNGVYQPASGWSADNSPLMRIVAAIPGMNAVGLYHDKLVFSFDLNYANNLATIPPVVVLTYMGTDASIQKGIVNSLVGNQRAAQGVGQPFLDSLESEKKKTDALLSKFETIDSNTFNQPVIRELAMVKMKLQKGLFARNAFSFENYPPGQWAFTAVHTNGKSGCRFPDFQNSWDMTFLPMGTYSFELSSLEYPIIYKGKIVLEE